MRTIPLTARNIERFPLALALDLGANYADEAAFHLRLAHPSKPRDPNHFSDPTHLAHGTRRAAQLWLEEISR